MKLRYAGTCRLCQTEISARTEAIYERRTKSVRCLTCVTVPAPTAAAEPRESEELAVVVPAAIADEVGPGTAGSSARREYERRKAKRETQIRNEHPKIGGLILALTDDPQTTRAWARGAVGEEKIGARLDELVSPTFDVLHDRRIPGTRANVDHIAVTTSGVWVIDPKRYAGRPSLKVEGGILRPRVEKLMVGGRDCSKLVAGMLWQMSRVQSALPEVQVNGVLCFVDSDWPVLGGEFRTQDVQVMKPKRLMKMLVELPPGTLDVPATYQLLASKFPPA